MMLFAYMLTGRSRSKFDTGIEQNFGKFMSLSHDSIFIALAWMLTWTDKLLIIGVGWVYRVIGQIVSHFSVLI